MYVMAVCLLALVLLFSLRKRYVPMGIASALSLWTFYGSLFFIAALALWLLWKHDYKGFLALCGASCLALLVLSPLLYVQLSNARDQLAAMGSWRNALGTVTIKNIVLFPLKFAVGRISFEPKWLYWLVALVWTAIVGAALYRPVQKNTQLFFLLTTPGVVGVAASFITPLLSYFRFLFLAIPLSLLLSYSPKRVWIVGGFLLWSVLYLLVPAFHREDWKGLAASLPAVGRLRRPEVGVIYGIPSSLDGLRYYAPQTHIRDIRTARQESMVVVPYTFPIYGIDAATYGYTVTNTILYRGVSLEYWSRKRENE